jgi:hypothetical protein
MRVVKESTPHSVTARNVSMNGAMPNLNLESDGGTVEMKEALTS